MNAHAMGLQEIDEPDDFMPHLESLGYTAVYLKRPGDKSDGLISAFDPTAFDLLEDPIELHFNFKTCPMMDRDNIALIMVLQDKRTGTPIIFSVNSKVVHH